MVKVESAILFEEMLSEANRGKTFKLVWPLDLDISSGSQTIKLLFRNVKTGYYLVCKIAPECLSECTIGSLFTDGKKVKEHAGNIFTCRIISRRHNQILPALKALTDEEYNLSHSFLIKSKDAAVRDKKVDFSNFCKHQLCLVFQEGADKIVIPCAVVAATYYFTSTSMREQVFSQNLRGLYEAASVDPQNNKASILLKPNAGDNDAMRIARFALIPRARQCWDFVMNFVRNHKRTVKREDGSEETFCPLAVDIPVEQELILKVRGLRVVKPEGGSTLVVFEILDENSQYPFNLLELQRRRHHHSVDKGPETVIQVEPDPTNRMVGSNPSRQYGAVDIAKHQPAANPHHADIEVIKVLVPPRKDGLFQQGIQFITEGKEEVDLSPQREMVGDQQTAKGNIVGKKNKAKRKSNSYEMPLDDFIAMVSKLENKPNVVALSISKRQPVPLKSRKLTGRLSLRETYNGKRNNRRKYVVVTFLYKNMHVKLVEIDQKGTSYRCSTYILISLSEIDDVMVDKVVGGYINGKHLSLTTAELANKKVSLISKIHPTNNSGAVTNKWCDLLLEDILAKTKCSAPGTLDTR